VVAADKRRPNRPAAPSGILGLMQVATLVIMTRVSTQ
jgi:hypothetical protein